MKAASFVPSSEDESETELLKDEDEEPKKKEKPSANIPQETKMASLQNQLREAIEKEDYERAAKLRDEITRLKGNN